MKEIEKFNYWVNNIDKLDSKTKEDLQNMRWETKLIEDAFGSDLEFGTAGLRGIMGAGTNRMNSTVVRKVSQGICRFLKKTSDDPVVVIAYDTRENSYEFAVAVCEVFCGNAIPVYMFNRTVPVPVLSYSIPRLGASLGIMITASHNSREYNGYKVYGAHGHQILDPIPEMILEECSEVDEFADVKSISIENAVRFSICAYVEESIIRSFYQDVISFGSGINSDIRVVYTPLNGSGLEFVTHILEMNGLTNLSVVENQLKQDGKFETCPYPNPEKKEAFEEAIKKADMTGANYIIATDPDCDRFGMAVRTEDGFRVLTGNEIGILLFNYILNTRKYHRKAIVYKSIVTLPIIDRIAKRHRIEVKDTLIGFKYVGEHVYNLEDSNKFVFGMEESHGYLIGPYCWDKDAVGASMLAVEMLEYYRDIPKALSEIYSEYGYIENRVYEYVDTSFEGKENIAKAVKGFRESDTAYRKTDFLTDDTGLPAANILKFRKEDITVYVRPSGTEPKLKIYIYAGGKTQEEAAFAADELKELFKNITLQFIKGDIDDNGND